jgi:hypothetical protein
VKYCFSCVARYGYLDLLESIGAELCRAKQNDEMVAKVYNSIAKRLGWNQPEDVKSVQDVMKYLLEILHSDEFKKDIESNSQERGKLFIQPYFYNLVLHLHR